jgi:hypothetical protein
MSKQSISATEMVRHFSHYINHVTAQRESILLCRRKKAIAELRPVPMVRRLGDLPGLIASLPRLSQQEADDFLRDVRAI